MEPVTQPKSVSLEVEATMEAVPVALEYAAYVSATNKYSLYHMSNNIIYF